MSAAEPFVVSRRVEFADTDLAGFVHFSNYLRYMEETEYAFLRSLNLDVILDDGDRGQLGFPRVESHCQYHRPARYKQEVEISLSVAANDGKRINYDFVIQRGDDLIATGRLGVVCCRFPLDRDPYAIPIPDWIIEKIPLIEPNGEPED